MENNEVLKNLRNHYREHLEWCKTLTDNIAAYMSDNGFGCTVFINDNLQIEVIYNIPRGGPESVPDLRVAFYKTLMKFICKNGFVKVLEESTLKKDFCMPEPYVNFYTERVVLDVE